MRDLLLGIDIGTSAAKAVLADVEGRVLYREEAGYSYSTPRAGWAEQDPLDWWRAVCAVVRKLCGRDPGLKARVACIGVSGQGVAALPLDKTGEPLRPAILWLDTRSASYAARLDEQMGDAIVTLSGKRPAAYNVEPKMLWLREHEPDVWQRTAKVTTTTGYVTFRLTGKMVMNHSDAGIMLAYDLRRNAWSAGLQERMQLPASVFCDLAPCAEVVGTLTAQAAEELGIQAGVPVVAGGEDTSSAALAVGGVSPAQAVLSMGTAGTVNTPLGRAATHRKLLAFPHVLPGLTLIGGSMAAGGGGMSWIARLVGDPSIPEEAAVPVAELERLSKEAAAVPPGAGGVVFLPYLAGELQPINDGFARGVFMGLTFSTRRSHLVRAVMEGIAFAIRHNLSVAGEIGARPETLVATGGPTRNAVWCQIIADVTGLPVHVVSEHGGAPLGDAVLAALGAGLIDRPEVMVQAHMRFGPRYEPSAEAHALYRDRFELYRGLYPRLADLFKRL